MKFRKEKTRDFHLRETAVENIFISEYMPMAGANDIKVYLLALMCADADEQLNNSIIAMQLGISEEDVMLAWNYWEEMGVIKKHYDNTEDRFRYQVEFLSLRERIYSPGLIDACEENMKTVGENLNGGPGDDIIKGTFDQIEKRAGRTMDSAEMSAVISWLDEFKLSPEFVIFAYDYCISRRNNNRFSYVSAVIREWVNQGLRTMEDVKKYLDETDMRHSQYKRVMKAMGFHRSPSEAEEKMMDVWFDQWNADLSAVLEACGRCTGIANPNFNYLNKVVAGIVGIKSPGNGKESGKAAPVQNSNASIKKIYDEIRNKNEAILNERKREIFSKIPRIKEIEEELHSVNSRISRAVLGGGPNKKMELEDCRRQISNLNEEKAVLLTDNNYQPNYLDTIYDCPHCKDTGVLETGERCSCYNQKLIMLNSK